MLESLLTPDSISIIGASAVPGKVGNDVVSNLIKSGFKGKIVPVNPKSEEILGIKCYKNLSEYEDKIDLSIITVPAKIALSAVQSSISAGAKAVTVITAGFKEVSEEGADLENKITAICKANQVRLLGPNVLGLINTHHNMNATFAHHMPVKGGISVISQSGAVCTAILD